MPVTTSSIGQIQDDVGRITGDLLAGGQSVPTTDDRAPYLQGTLSQRLAVDEHVALYRREAGATQWERITNDNGIRSKDLTWAFSDRGLEDGVTYEYMARVEDRAGNHAPNSVVRTIAVDTAAPTAPGLAPDMLASSDTGARSDDDITGDNTPALQVFGVPEDAAQVELLLNGQPIPAVYNAATGTVTPLNGLPDGAHRLSYRFVDATGNTSAASPELAVVSDTQAPTQALTAPDLLDASDTGRSDSDNLTSDRTPSMGVVRGDASLTPKLLVNGVEVASQFDAATGSLTPLTALPVLRSRDTVPSATWFSPATSCVATRAAVVPTLVPSKLWAPAWAAASVMFSSWFRTTR
jgi:hypothetical protein